MYLPVAVGWLSNNMCDYVLFLCLIIYFYGFFSQVGILIESSIVDIQRIEKYTWNSFETKTANNRILVLWLEEYYLNVLRVLRLRLK